MKINRPVLQVLIMRHTFLECRGILCSSLPKCVLAYSGLNLTEDSEKGE